LVSTVVASREGGDDFGPHLFGLPPFGIPMAPICTSADKSKSPLTAKRLLMVKESPLEKEFLFDPIFDPGYNKIMF